MRILDPSSDSPVYQISLFLTKSEASELRDLLNLLLSDPKIHHEHVLSDDYSKELTVAIYDSNNTDGFDERSKILILEDR